MAIWIAVVASGRAKAARTKADGAKGFEYKCARLWALVRHGRPKTDRVEADQRRFASLRLRQGRP